MKANLLSETFKQILYKAHSKKNKIHVLLKPPLASTHARVHTHTHIQSFIHMMKQLSWTVNVCASQLVFLMKISPKFTKSL